MAPFLGPTRAEVVELLSGPAPEGRLPIVLGVNVPTAEIVRLGERWIFRTLEPDLSFETRRSPSESAPEPEMFQAPRVPGKLVFDCASPKALAKKLSWRWRLKVHFPG